MLDQQCADYLLSKIQGYTWTEGCDFSFSDIDGRILVSTREYETGRVNPAASHMIKEYNNNQFHAPDTIVMDPEGGSGWALLTLKGFAIGAFEARGSNIDRRAIREILEILNILTAGYCKENLEEGSQKALNEFYEDWLIGKKSYHRSPIEKAEYNYYRFHDSRDDANFILRGKILGIDITIPRTVFVLKMVKDPAEEGERLSIEAKRRLQYKMEGYLSNDIHNLHVMFGDYIILLLPGTEDEVLYTINRVRSNLEMMYECKVNGGISEQYTDWRDAGERFRKAKMACDTALLVEDRSLIKYDVRSVSLMLNMIPVEMRREFYGKIFQSCEEEEIDEYLETMKVFFECDRSISRTAERMFVHKNTLKYRLSRMKEKLGLDPRDSQDSMMLYFLLLLRQLEEVS